MRIAIICSYYPWPPSVGGVETIVRNVAVELARRGHEVHVVCSLLDVTTQNPVTNLGIEERNGVVIHKLKPSKFRVGYARILKGLKEEVAKIKPDVVHAHNLHPHLFQLAKWKGELGYKLIAELHYPAVNLDYLIQRILLKPAVKTLKLFSKNIDKFVAHTKLEKTWLEQQGTESTRIEILPTQHVSTILFEHKTKTSREDCMVLFLSRIVPKKGVHFLIKAFHEVRTHVPKSKLVIAGPEDSKYKRKLLDMVRELQLENAVKFLGFVTEEKKLELVASATVFCLPTLADYHPIVLLEAQALETPVVATRVGAIPEIVLDGETGFLVEPNNPRELAEVIIRLIEDEELWRRFSTKAREWAGNFTLEKRVDELESLYREVLNRD